MRCRPGDLAFVISASDPKWIGKILTVVRVASPPTNGKDSAWWETDVEGWIFRDESLRPISDPGDSVQDVRDVLVPEHLRVREEA